jgi:hypothetical protein
LASADESNHSLPFELVNPGVISIDEQGSSRSGQPTIAHFQHWVVKVGD